MINQREKKAKEFIERWKSRGDERSDTQSFWNELLHDVFDVERPTEYIKYEKSVKDGTTKFVDARIYDTKVIIEQKSLGIDLTKPEKQSDGTLLSPVEQGRRYAKNIYDNEGKDASPEWLIACNFEEFHIYDLKGNKGSNKLIIKLSELDKQYHNLDFLVKHENIELKKEMQLSFDAGRLVGKLYDAIKPQYKNPESIESLRSLNILCVRLVFCLYAEDSGLFGKNAAFTDYFRTVQIDNFGSTLKNFFRILNTEENKRDPYENKVLNSFPYVNGGLFADDDVEIPNFTEEIRQILVKDCGDDFNWSGISPTIFGAIFESTLNPETRRSGGMHYTSIENIHKVIDPLFLNDLNDEFAEIASISVINTRNKKLDAFIDKMSTLTFLDPACGSGNFLTETYRELRKLENKCLRLKMDSIKGQTEGAIRIITGDSPIKVSINQFYGIEINDFAVTVAKTALWIAESQMLKETEEILMHNIDFLPLKSYNNIIEGNALRLDWDKCFETEEKVDYIVGNPPFVGYGLQSNDQKNDVLNIFIDENGRTYNTAGKIDYVACWYYKASKYIVNTNTKVAFVSTNSICQGEQVNNIWAPIFKLFNIEFIFCHRTFKWNSESNEIAAVYCIIIGFCYKNSINKFLNKKIYDSNTFVYSNRINPYLIDADDIFINSISKPLCTIPKMITGNRPADGGNLIIEDEDYDDFISKEPNAKKYIKKLTGADEYINNINRYCLWLVDCPPNELKQMPLVLQRVKKCKEDRLKGAPDRQKLANTPMLFRETKNPKHFIIIPCVSSEKRRYIPIGFLDSTTIPTNAATIIPEAPISLFSVLISNVHMAWMRTVAGRLKSDYRYSKDIVYNNFPWPVDISKGDKNLTNKEKELIKKGYPTIDKDGTDILGKTGKAILDARNLYKESSLADLYDPDTMPPELVKAHRENDKAVCKVYGFTKEETTNESACVSRLLELYKMLINN